jgi:hypothetical protein
MLNRARRWLNRKRLNRERQIIQDASDWDKARADSGWKSWLYDPPTLVDLVEVSRREWPTIQVIRVRDVSPYMNARGLWWRPARDGFIDGEIILDLVVQKPPHSQSAP